MTAQDYIDLGIAIESVLDTAMEATEKKLISTYVPLLLTEE